MNIDTLVESFYTKQDETESLISEVLALFLDKPGSTILLEQKGYTLTWDGIPDIPISEIPWSDVKTVEGGGADIQGPQRQQLMQFLDDIEGDDLMHWATLLSLKHSRRLLHTLTPHLPASLLKPFWEYSWAVHRLPPVKERLLT